MRSGVRQGIGLAAFVLLCLLAEGGAAWLTSLSVADWYPSLRKPAWTPPGWLFGPVWTILYLSMAVSGWLVWRKRGFSGARLPLALFAAQLLLNVAWSGIFFGLRDPGLAFGEIALLWLAIAATQALFSRRSRAAGWLLLPYHAWVSYAAALNLAIWRMNA